MFFAYFKWDSRWAFMSNGFLLATLPYMLDLWSAWDIVVTCILWPVLAINACRSFKVAIGLLVASDQSPTCSVIQFGGMAWCRQGLVGAINLPRLNNHIQVIFKAFEMFHTHPLISAFPQLCPRVLLKAPWCSLLSVCLTWCVILKVIGYTWANLGLLLQRGGHLSNQAISVYLFFTTFSPQFRGI